MGDGWSERPPPQIVQEGDDLDEGPDPMIGQVLSGLYRVDSRIGEGGMGSVYMAVHIHLNKPFAVKVLSEKVAANRQAIDRLKMEAQAASSIDHDNIVDVINFDATQDGRFFLVMEMLKGASLADLMDKGPMKLERALPIIYQVCEALEAAHQAAIVHRDLKPENVFIVRKSDSDFVKVLDFGISKVKTAEAEQVRMTKTGQLVGTPLYMSPEQAKGETDVDHRSDIYSAGVMLYEMVTGRPPFEGGNYFQLLWKHGNEPAEDPTKYRKDLPAGIAKAILCCLEKEPAKRYQSMAELQAALRSGAPGIGTHPERLASFGPGEFPSGAIPAAPAPGSSRAKLAIGISMLVAIAVGATAWVSRGTEPEPEPEPAPIVTSVEPEPSPEPEAQIEPEAEPEAELPSGAPLPVTQATVHFESTPPGARVLVDDTQVGETPCDIPFDAGAEIEARIVLGGYVPAVVELVAEDGLEIRRRLRRRQSATMDTNALMHFKMGF